MVSYAYARECTPPAPFVHVTLRSPDGITAVADFPAQLDTAADRTVVPLRVIEELHLVQMGTITESGVGGQVAVLPAFLVELTVRQLQPLALKVIASPEEPFVPLGRDVLNRYRIVLDGPQLALEIG
jgi:hypothetical protein